MNWEKKDVPKELVREIVTKYKCDQITATILARRGYTKGEEIKYFLEDAPRYLHNPFDIPDMDEAVERIIAAKEEGEKVMVFGDRDVDGITSTALLTGVLRQMGIDVQWRIPIGDESYGLSMEAVDDFAAEYGTLIITVDCGISNYAEVKHAAELNIDVIITDHHNPQKERPEALAIVNPKLPESRYPFRDLAGCGVAYKLAVALRFALRSPLFGQPICLMNIRPANDAYIIEIVKMCNLSIIDKLNESVMPGVLSIEKTRIPTFLKSQQIFVWDARLQKTLFAKIFGNGIDIQMYDIKPEISSAIPSTSDKSLFRLKEESSLARYSDTELEEIDVFVNLFISFVHKKEAYFNEEDKKDLQLAALGAVGDIMPLENENRVIVRLGLEAMNTKARPGLDALLTKLDLLGTKNITANDLGWSVCPAINAAGRMGSPEVAVRMLLCEDDKNKLADELIDFNKQRRKIADETWDIIMPLAQKALPEYSNKFAVALCDIARGVTGIMANRMVSFFKTPALVASVGDGIITGSLRSTGGYDLTDILEENADLFIDKGGHNYAAGFSMNMENENWKLLLERLKARAALIELAEEGTELIDAEIPASYLNPDLLKIVDRFEPYGSHNETLTFLARNVRVQEMNLVGKNVSNHVKLVLDTGKYKWDAIYWNAAERVKKDFDKNDKIDIVFKITRNFFKGTSSPQIELKDLWRSDEV